MSVLYLASPSLGKGFGDIEAAFWRIRKRVVFPFRSSMLGTRTSRPYNSAASVEQIAALSPLVSPATSSAALDVDVVSTRSVCRRCCVRKGVH